MNAPQRTGTGAVGRCSGLPQLARAPRSADTPRSSFLLTGGWLRLSGNRGALAPHIKGQRVQERGHLHPLARSQESGGVDMAEVVTEVPAEVAAEVPAQEVPVSALSDEVLCARYNAAEPTDPDFRALKDEFKRRLQRFREQQVEARLRANHER